MTMTNAVLTEPEAAAAAPVVSVLIALYNTNETHLREAIDSILGQSFADFELLLLDDGSTEPRVERVVGEYRDPRIRYLRNPENLGISPTRNRLLDLARGKYVAIMDHDDVSLPDRFEKQVAYLDAHPDVGVVSGHYEYFENRDGVVRWPEEDEDIRQMLMLECAVSHSAAMMRKRVLFDHRIRYEAKFSPAEDYGLWCQLLPFTRFHNIPEVLLRYRVHAANCSAVQSAKMERGSQAVRSFARANNPALYDMVYGNVTCVTRVKLFGVIPVLKIVTQKQRTRCTTLRLPFFNVSRTFRFE